MISSRPSNTPPDHARMERAVSHALAATFENMVFLDTAALSEFPALGNEELQARISSRAPFDAIFTLRLSTPLVDACIETLYAGTETNDTVREDVVRELLNTLAGIVLSDLTDDDCIQLGLPESGVKLPAVNASSVGQAYTSDLRSVAFSVNWS
jgi:hypothetical protein